MVSNVFQVFLIFLGLGNASDEGEFSNCKYNLLITYSIFTVVFYLIIARKLRNPNNVQVWTWTCKLEINSVLLKSVLCLQTVNKQLGVRISALRLGYAGQSQYKILHT